MVRAKIVVAVAVAIVCWQLFVPPIIGIADQSDFLRVIGRFGWGPEQRGLNLAYVAPKYVHDSSSRVKDWEQFSSQYFFVAAALACNRIVSRDGKLDIEVMGFIYALAFLAAFARLVQAAAASRARVLLWIAMLLILTDVAYVAYLNTFYAEPASAIFFLLLAAESAVIVQRGKATRGALLRWSLWAILFVLAKPVNAAVGFLLAIFLLRFYRASRIAWAGCAAILAAAVFIGATAPKEMRNAMTYNLVFLAVLPESRHPAEDLQALGLDWHLQDFSRTGAWSPNTMYPPLEARGDIGGRVTQTTVLRFYLSRPTRFWRHMQAMLPVMLRLRPPYGNFEPQPGHPPALSREFALWSDFHERVLARFAKFILFALLAPPMFVLARWRRRDLAIEFLALLGVAAVVAFLAAIFGDAWDDIKHMFLFNLLFDAFVVSAIACVFRARPASNIEV